MCLTEKLLGASLHPRLCRFSTCFHPTGGGDIPSIPVLQNTTEGRNGLSFGYLLSKFSKMVYKQT